MAVFGRNQLIDQETLKKDELAEQKDDSLEQPAEAGVLVAAASPTVVASSTWAGMLLQLEKLKSTGEGVRAP